MEKVLLGVIGLSMGRMHLSGIVENGFEIGAICDVDPEVLKRVGDEFHVAEERRFLDWHDVVALSDVNAVVIVTPDQLHREMCETFLSAGKHVLCEKPLALLREDLDAIIAASKKAHTKFMVGQICRFNPGFLKMKELIDEGKIGDIYYMESEYAHDYAKILHGWRADPNRHGVVGGGCHAVDLMRWFLGDPTEVFAYGVHKMLPDVTYNDTTVGVLKFPNEVIGKVFVSTGCKRNYTMRTLVYGTKGTLIYKDKKTAVRYFGLAEDGVSLAPVQLFDFEERDHNTFGEIKMFVDHILNDTPVILTAEQGAKTVATCLAIVESSKTGKPVVPDYNF